MVRSCDNMSAYSESPILFQKLLLKLVCETNSWFIQNSGTILTQRSHFFWKIRPEAAKQATIGQQVERGVTPHGVKGEGVDSRGEARHVTHLPFPVGCHGDNQLLKAGQGG